jgi:CubicO group peptidase (beta-lactamase class C family)
MVRSLASLNLAVLLCLAACDPPEDEVDFRSKPANHKHSKNYGKNPGKGNYIYPGQDWQTGAPEDHGLSSSGLAELTQLAEELDSTCLMVIHDGVVVSEWYPDGYGPDTVHTNLFSITKSVTGTLVGIARDQDLLELDDEVADFIDLWVGSPSDAVTVRNLVSNDSGRFWSFESDYLNLMFLPDQTEYAVGLDQAVAPGEFWEYNNSAVQTLEAVLEQATGEDVDAFAQANLFEPIGMTATLASDPSGNTLTYQGMAATCPDLARLAYLMLREGRWNNKQVVPKAWVKQSTQPSTDLNDAYGFLWWVNAQGTVVRPSFPNRDEYEGKLVPASPDKLFLAAGAFGQMAAVDPESGYVVIRLQDVADVQAALAADPDPVGLTKIEALLTTFENAKF